MQVLLITFLYFPTPKLMEILSTVTVLKKKKVYIFYIYICKCFPTVSAMQIVIGTVPRVGVIIQTKLEMKTIKLHCPFKKQTVQNSKIDLLEILYAI